RERRIAFQQVDQCAGIEKNDHQSRSSPRVMSISALSRVPISGCDSSHRKVVMPGRACDWPPMRR
ncbi:MAG: hypothetical protein OZ916_08245, partial [Nitrosomonas sp.]|uniref:hypothetical protein n=1 Tax=Nitrosomonas sp. TaxID=42353 RepID=UPI002B37E0E7